MNAEAKSYEHGFGLGRASAQSDLAKIPEFALVIVNQHARENVSQGAWDNGYKDGYRSAVNDWRDSRKG